MQRSELAQDATTGESVPRPDELIAQMPADGANRETQPGTDTAVDEPIEHESPSRTEPADSPAAGQPAPATGHIAPPPEPHAHPEQTPEPEPAAEAEPTTEVEPGAEAGARQTTEETADACAPAPTLTPGPRPASRVEAESTPVAIPEQAGARPALTPGSTPREPVSPPESEPAAAAAARGPRPHPSDSPVPPEPVADGAPSESRDETGSGVPVVSPGWGHLAESEDSSEAEREPDVDDRVRDTQRGPGRGRQWGRRAVVAVATLVLMGIIPAFIARMYTIPSESMETTLHGCAGCDNDRVLVDRMVYRFRDPHPGEVVVFTPGPQVWSNSEEQQPPETNPLILGLRSLGSKIGITERSGPDFVKRVIAVGGQTVSCCDSRNRIMVDGVAVDEPYVYFSPAAGPAQQTPFPKITVPAAMMWMMGDNRNASLDSRAPGNGPVPLAALDGKVRMVIYPFSRLGSVEDTNPQTHR